jgi:hypothetical protein
VSDAANKAALLEQEAVEILNRSFLRLPQGVGSEGSIKLVECLVGAAILRVADLQAQAIKRTADSASSANVRTDPL